MAGLLIGFAGVAALVGFDIDAADLGSVAAIVVVAFCYALGPLILSRYLSGLPGIGRRRRVARDHRSDLPAVRRQPVAEWSGVDPGVAVGDCAWPSCAQRSRSWSSSSWSPKSVPLARRDHLRQPGRRAGAGRHRPGRDSHRRDTGRLRASSWSDPSSPRLATASSRRHPATRPRCRLDLPVQPTRRTLGSRWWLPRFDSAS